MNTISNRQKTTAIAAIGAAAVFGMLSFGSSAQAATHSYNCQFLNGVLGLSCCDRMMGSQVINVSASCHEPKKYVHKIRRRLPPPNTIITLTAIEKEGGGNGGGGGDDGGHKGKGPNSL